MIRLLFVVLSTFIGISPSFCKTSTSIHCPSFQEYSCVEDTTCPRSRCTATSTAALPWNFLAPVRPLSKVTKELSSCSLLPPGHYYSKYMASLYGEAGTLGWVAYCMYAHFDQEGLAMSAYYAEGYKKGNGDWKKGDDTLSTYFCVDSKECEFESVTGPTHFHT